MDIEITTEQESWYQQDWITSWWFILIVIQAIIGLYMFEKSWKNTLRFRQPPSKELNELFPAFCRKDALKWTKWRLYPGAMFLLVPRFTLLTFFFAMKVFTMSILLLCHKEERPLSGCRKCLVTFSLKFWSRLEGVFGFFTWHSYKYLSDDEVDYSEYLGTTELMPVDSSIGGVMKEFYATTAEHSSRIIRQNTGADFINYGSQINVDKEFFGS